MHIGKEIHQELKRQGRTVVWFAEHMCCDRSTAYEIFKKETIDTGQLIRISRLLKKNFLESLMKEIDSDLGKYPTNM